MEYRASILPFPFKPSYKRVCLKEDRCACTTGLCVNIRFYSWSMWQHISPSISDSYVGTHTHQAHINFQYQSDSTVSTGSLSRGKRIGIRWARVSAKLLVYFYVYNMFLVTQRLTFLSANSTWKKIWKCHSVETRYAN